MLAVHAELREEGRLELRRRVGLVGWMDSQSTAPDRVHEDAAVLAVMPHGGHMPSCGSGRMINQSGGWRCWGGLLGCLGRCNHSQMKQGVGCFDAWLMVRAGAIAARGAPRGCKVEAVTDHR